MIKKIASSASSNLAEKANFDKEKEEVLTYMFIRIITNITMLSLLLALSTFLNIRTSTFIVLISFYFIRRCFGGWHTENVYMCTLISIIVPLSAGYLAKVISMNFIILLGTYVVSYVIAFKIGVVDNKNKRIKASRKKSFEKQGLITLTVLLIINLTLFTSSFFLISNSIYLGVILGFGNLLFSKK